LEKAAQAGKNERIEDYSPDFLAFSILFQIAAHRNTSKQSMTAIVSSAVRNKINAITTPRRFKHHVTQSCNSAPRSGKNFNAAPHNKAEP
jgi:hypothetical protein